MSNDRSDLDTPEPVPGLPGAVWLWHQPAGALHPFGVLELPPPTCAELWWIGGPVWQWRDGQTGAVLRALRAASC